MKATLSDQQEAKLDIPELDIELLVTRQQFESIITELLAKFEKAVADVLKIGGLTPNDMQLVIRTGGSSLIPAVKRILDNQFCGMVIEHDPFTSVAAGLAIAEYLGLGSTGSESTTS
jgi:hypothetical chaperone protein